MQQKPPPPNSKPGSGQASTLSKLRGVAQLATQATLAASRMAEGVHSSVWGSMGVSGGKLPGQAGGLTGLIYTSVRGIAGLAGGAADAVLKAMEPLAEASAQAGADSPVQQAVLAALNGVMGDQLAANGNPLATQMGLRHDQRMLSPEQMPAPHEVTGHVLLLVHGLCMNDAQWGADPDLGLELAAALGGTPLYARYNTGRHTSDNGELLSQQLAAVAAHWPVPLQNITVVAHSMGGLVIRSAAEHARQTDQAWLGRLKSIVFLGTPHHGAPLERAGHWVDVLLGVSAYSRPFKRLAQLRSAGITDLRHGHTQTADWQGRSRFDSARDHRSPLPLPAEVACYTVAATLAAPKGLLAERLLGDGLVPLHSALGHHSQPQRRLQFPKAHQHIAHHTGHMALLHSAAVREQLITWLR